MRVFTKEELIQELREINQRGWIRNQNRSTNQGAIGNMLEDLLGIAENNLPIPNASEWELKTSRNGTTSLVTLFHLEPSPTALRIVPEILLPKYGWKHQKAGDRYPDNEMSFRQTIRVQTSSDRGFRVVVNQQVRRVEISFDAAMIGERHTAWRKEVEGRIGLAEIDPQPYWGFDDLIHKAGTKLKNMFFVQASRKRQNGEEYFHYDRALMLSQFDPDKFIGSIESGLIYVDFDARTGHNHGTKFRMKQNLLPSLYASVREIF